MNIAGMTNVDLLIDVGNSRIKWYLSSHDNPSFSMRSFAYHEDNVIKEMAFHFAPECVEPFHRVLVSNVAGDQIKSKIIQWFVDRFNVTPEFAESCDEMHGLRSAYDHANQLGVDRFLAILGAQSLSGKARVIVDCGTAVTIECVNGQNKFIGGVILPGLGLMRHSLANATDALENISQVQEISAFATNTRTAIAAGTIFAITGAIQQSVAQLKTIENQYVECFLSGGDGKLIQQYLDCNAEYHEDLVLKGLSIYFQAR